MNSIPRKLLCFGLWGLLTSCDGDLTATGEDLGAATEEGVKTAAKISMEGCIDPDLSKVRNDVTLTLCNGELAKGLLPICTADGIAGCVTNEAFLSADMSGFTATHVRSGATVAGVSGSLADCTSNNVIDCVTNSTYKSADLTNLLPGNIKDTVEIAGVMGTHSGASVPNDCFEDGQENCITTSSFPAAKASDAVAGNIKSGITIGGTLGTYAPSCSSDGGTACFVNGTDYVAAAKTNAIAGNVKSGVVLAGVTGNYPSATSRLAGADSTTADLTASTFENQIKASDDFEWFDSAGNRYTQAGEPKIAPGLLLNGVSIFGTVGTFSLSGLKISNFSGTKGTGKIVLSWTRTGGSGVIIVRNSTAAVSFNPSNSVNYNQGFTSGNDEIIYKGSATTIDDTDIVDDQYYYYRAFAYNADLGYSESTDVTVYNGSQEVCGAVGYSCYDNAIAIADGKAKTPLGKNLEYVTASGSFKVWKEVGTNNILRANGLDEWATKLNLNGKGFISGSGNEFSNYSSLAGRVCPTNVYIDDNHKFTTDNCLYYTATSTSALNAAGTSQTDNGSIGLGLWNSYNGGSPKWMVGNIQYCADHGMRLPTIYETTSTNSAYAKNPSSDGTPTFAGATGVPSGGNYTWTASSCVSSTGVCSAYDLFLMWNGTATAEYYSNSATYPLRCVLP